MQAAEHKLNTPTPGRPRMCVQRVFNELQEAARELDTRTIIAQSGNSFEGNMQMALQALDLQVVQLAGLCSSDQLRPVNCHTRQWTRSVECAPFLETQCSAVALGHLT